MPALAEGTLLGCGNPLLDLQTNVDKEFLAKWGLKEDDAILAEDKHVPMLFRFAEMIAKYEIEYIPGGATQNALRVCQWILKNQPKATTFFGSVGKDEYAQKLREKATGAGVNVHYQVHDDQKTGTCAALITGHSRSLCAHLAAANSFTPDHLSVPENRALLEKAEFYYIAGFFLTVCPPAIMQVAKLAAEKDRPFMMNLSAPFLSQFFKEPQLAALPYVDILFGNEDEFAAFAKENNLGVTEMQDIAMKVSQWEKVNTKRQRRVVITQGDRQTIVACCGKIKTFDVNKLTAEQLVDTNGAGDAFVGGYLAQYIQGMPVEECINCGHYAASVIIQQQGCTFPAESAYKPLSG